MLLYNSDNSGFNMDSEEVMVEMKETGKSPDSQPGQFLIYPGVWETGSENSMQFICVILYINLA